MADTLLSMEEVREQLQLTKNQVMVLVKQSALRGFLDQKTYKFRMADVEHYKQRVESGATVVLGGTADDDVPSDMEVTEVQRPPGEKAKSDTSRIDLADIEGEADADESDQTSVLAPVEDEEDESTKEEAAAFGFSEEDLGLALEDDAVDSVLVADESESSVDILDTIEESSSESATSTTDLELIEESSSEEVAAVADVEETDSGVQAVTADAVAEVEESSDEDIETLDLEEVAEAPELAVEEPEKEMAEVAELAPEEGPATETVETLPLEGEAETVGISAKDSTTLAEEALEEGLLAEEAAAEGLLAEEVEEAGAEEELEAEPELEEAPAIAGGWDIVVPWAPGNALLIAAIVLLAAGGVFLFCEMAGVSNDFTAGVVEFVNKYVPNK